jgi:hypothetical protein
MQIDLNGDEFDVLLIALGYATGAVSKDNPGLADSFMRIANAVNRNNPLWTPYEVPEKRPAQ